MGRLIFTCTCTHGCCCCLACWCCFSVCYPVIASSASFSRSFAEVVADLASACATSVHESAFNSGLCSQGPRRRKRVKGGVSGPAEDLRPVSEVAAGVNSRPAGGVREQVAGLLPRRQPGTGTRRPRVGVVTPSLHPEVPGIQFVSPGRGVDIRQSMGWTKVCGTAPSGIWVLKGNARTCMFPANLDHLRVEWMKRSAYKTAWVTPGHDCLCSFKCGHGAAVRPSGMGLLVCGAGSHPSYHLGVVRRMCQRG